MPSKHQDAPAPVESVTDPLSLILAEIQGVRQDLQQLDRRVAVVEDKSQQQELRTVKFQPMQPAPGLNKPPFDLSSLQQAGAYTEGGANLPVSTDGRIVSYLRNYWPVGTIVRINPKSDLYRRLKTAYSQAVNAGRRPEVDPDAVEGVIAASPTLNRDLKWKYRVVFEDWLTKRGDGFWEDDLVPAQ